MINAQGWRQGEGTTVDLALIRGLIPHDQGSLRGCLCLTIDRGLSCWRCVPGPSLAPYPQTGTSPFPVGLRPVGAGVIVSTEALRWNTLLGDFVFITETGGIRAPRGSISAIGTLRKL